MGPVKSLKSRSRRSGAPRAPSQLLCIGRRAIGPLRGVRPLGLHAGEFPAGQLHLEVRDGNPAVRLYKRAGFSQVGRRRNYYSGRDGQLFDALTLAKTFQV